MPQPRTPFYLECERMATMAVVRLAGLESIAHSIDASSHEKRTEWIYYLDAIVYGTANRLYVWGLSQETISGLGTDWEYSFNLALEVSKRCRRTIEGEIETQQPSESLIDFGKRVLDQGEQSDEEEVQEIAGALNTLWRRPHAKSNILWEKGWDD